MPPTIFNVIAYIHGHDISIYIYTICNSQQQCTFPKIYPRKQFRFQICAHANCTHCTIFSCICCWGGTYINIDFYIWKALEEVCRAVFLDMYVYETTTHLNQLQWVDIYILICALICGHYNEENLTKKYSK